MNVLDDIDGLLVAMGNRDGDDSSTDLRDEIGRLESIRAKLLTSARRSTPPRGTALELDTTPPNAPAVPTDRARFYVAAFKLARALNVPLDQSTPDHEILEAIAEAVTPALADAFRDGYKHGACNVQCDERGLARGPYRNPFDVDAKDPLT